MWAVLESTQVAKPGLLYDDSRQQSSCESLPVDSVVHPPPKVEAQLKQFVRSEPSVYLPERQTEQPLDPDAEILPAAHVKHTDSEVWPLAVEYLPAAQSVQTLVPVAAEYFPAAQSVHCWAPAAEYLPAAQS